MGTPELLSELRDLLVACDPPVRPSASPLNVLITASLAHFVALCKIVVLLAFVHFTTARCSSASAARVERACPTGRPHPMIDFFRGLLQISNLICTEQLS